MGLLRIEVTGAVGAAAHREVGAPVQEAIEDRLGEVSIMQHFAQGRQRFLEQPRAVGEIAFVDDAVEHVRRVGRGGQVAELVNDEVRNPRRFCGRWLSFQRASMTP